MSVNATGRGGPVGQRNVPPPTPDEVKSAYEDPKVAKTPMPAKMDVAFLKYARENPQEWEQGVGPAAFAKAELKAFFTEGLIPKQVTAALIDGIREYDRTGTLSLSRLSSMVVNGTKHYVVERDVHGGTTETSIIDDRGRTELKLSKDMQPIQPAGWR